MTMVEALSFILIVVALLSIKLIVPRHTLETWKRETLFPLGRQAAYTLGRLVAVVWHRIERLARPR